MNPSTRTFAILGFSLAISKDLTACHEPRVAWRAKQLLKAATNAASRYPSAELNKNQVKQIGKAIKQLNKFELTGSGSRNLVPTLALILCGIDDVLAHTKNQLTTDLFQDFQKKVMWLNDLVDTKLNRENDYVKGEWAYNEWMSA